MAEWSSVVVAKSLALVCTKDQRQVLFFYLEPKQIFFFFFQNPQMKNQKRRKKERKKDPPFPPNKNKNWKQKLNTFQVIRTNSYPMILKLV